MNLREFFTAHTWWGKIFGAFLGYLMAGPVGALFGLLIGNFFDHGLAEHFSRPHWLYHAEKRGVVQKIFFEATFSIIGHIAKADGRVSEKEIQMAATLMDEMGLNGKQREEAKRYFREGKKTTFNVTHILQLLKEVTQDNPDLLRLFLDIQYRSACVDGLSQPKLTAMNIVLRHLGFAPLHQQNRFYEDFFNQYQQYSRQHTSNNQYSRTYQSTSHLDQAYAILEINPNASKQEVKKAYRKLISRNHPDRLIAKGLPEAMIKMANDKTQKITKAYEAICKSKGW
ncbi:DNA binding protein DnaJ, heat shock protein (plasmid) [Legionella adelaidensis]|uniref:Co-chaperone protein DjlA n=1 Tax=Legionella adelaidensis TaxID=45056 RepID=A0A0W0R2V1_9GAMM|nr:co-chaperone DjlA [Legionella adelaidensis]KTC65393.1 DNA binding protein DnaJ, heat shock protein [Legionella adelaidensis]VEH84785.1 DNA binding protein DnaJ, heat shock protein [Legionella adelaidensis]